MDEDVDFPRYWVTRDEHPDGTLSDHVDVWLEAPTRLTPPAGGVIWNDSSVSGYSNRYAEWSIAACAKNCNTQPDDSRQCIVVG